jgi:3',5'-cyclic AMP phosphodiesterase CpdA
MINRRNFIENAVKVTAGFTILPSISAFADTNVTGNKDPKSKVKLRFVLASDGHYAQPGTDSKLFYKNLIAWLNHEHSKNHLDLIIINGDLVHDRPDLLAEVKNTYLDKLPVPYYTLPGNHDFADAKIWKSVFGYEDNYVIDHGDTAFVLANTANTKGEYVCPNNTFLKASLDQFKNKTNVFVVLHIAPHQWVPEDAKTFSNCPETVELLHSYPNIKAVFHGHDHSIDGVRYTKHLPHFFDSHFGGNWGTSYKGYRIVEVLEDNHMVTYQINGSLNPILNTTSF